MKRLPLVLITLLALFFIPQKASAQILTVTPEGEIVFNVLSEESDTAIEIPRHSYIEVKRVGEEGVSEDSSVFLSKSGGKISLVVSSGNETRELNVSSQNQALVEVEERPEIQKVLIGVLDDKFFLQQKGISAVTDYSVNVDAASANLSVLTPTGERFLSVLPKDAVDSALKTKIVSTISSNQVEIQEKEGEVQYKIDGTKVFDLFGFYAYKIPVTAFVSASTGEVLGIDSPTWFKYVGFLFI